jgi:hypothetical protein
MTATLAAGVALALVLTVLNLVLTFAVIRKLRDGVGSGSSVHTPAAGLPRPGTRIGEFTVDTADGAVLTERDLLGDRTLVAFVSPTCAPCKDVVAELASTEHPPLRAFVVGDGGAETMDVVATLRPHGAVAVIEADHAAARAFGGVDGYPALLLVEGGVVAAAGRRLAEVREPTTVAAGSLESLLGP